MLCHTSHTLLRGMYRILLFPDGFMLDFIFVLRKISIELSERHLHHKIKRHTLHISILDKINMCL